MCKHVSLDVADNNLYLKYLAFIIILLKLFILT